MEEELFEYDLGFKKVTARDIAMVDWDKGGDLIAIVLFGDKERFWVSEKGLGDGLGFPWSCPWEFCRGIIQDIGYYSFLIFWEKSKWIKEELQIILNVLPFRKGNSQVMIEGVKHWIALKRLDRTWPDENELFRQHQLLTSHIWLIVPSFYYHFKYWAFQTWRATCKINRASIYI